MRQDKIPIPAKALEGLEAARLSRQTNMLDVPTVVRLASEKGYSEAAIWVHENKSLYAQGVIRGFEPEESFESASGMDQTATGSEGGDDPCVDK